MVQNDNRNKNQHTLLQYLLKLDRTTFLGYAFPHGLLHRLHLLPERDTGRRWWPCCISPVDGPIITLQWNLKRHWQTDLKPQPQSHEMCVENVYTMNPAIYRTVCNKESAILLLFDLEYNILFSTYRGVTAVSHVYRLVHKVKPSKATCPLQRKWYSWTWLNTKYIC